MKKLFTLVALLAFFLGAKAETVVDYECDYSTASSWAHGWLNEEEHITFEDGCIHFHSDEAQQYFYSFQYQIHPGIASVDNDALYTITIRIKGSVAQDIHASFSGSSTPGMIPVTTDWVDVVLENCVNNPDDQYFPNSGCLLIQPGDYVGDIWISYIKITHEEKGSSRPVVWLEQLTNDGTPEGTWMGDAEFGAWPAWSLALDEENHNINWRGDRVGEICAWALTMGRNFQPSVINDDSDRARPYPADIETDPDDAENHVFVVNAEQVDLVDPSDEGSIAWANQFWIQSPKGWKSGTKVKLHFRYKAEHGCTVGTQIHKQHPSDYLHYVGIGDVTFTTEWQEFNGTLTISDAQANGWSVAFNLNSDATNGRTANKFYFDDLSWQVMQLDEGWFVASSNTKTGLEYDYENALDMTYDEGEDAFVATVGTAGKEDTWVNEVMISTVRGETAAFKGATIKPTKTINTGDDPDNWLDYKAGSQAKITLPAAGVWQIFVAPATDEEIADDPTKAGTGQILFMMLEGEEIVKPDPIDIVTNHTEIIVKGQERQPTAAEQPADEEAGTPAGTGMAWDNQFFIVANREFKTGEKVTLKFKYKAANTTAAYPVKTTTQLHGAPGAYVYWNAIGEVSFAEDWQDFEKTWEISAGDEGKEITCKSIAFNMAEIKEACDYYIKDVQWYLADDELEEDKTYENLINAEGDLNFYVKEGAGTNPYIPSGIINVINDATTGSNVIYNLSGQRVSKDYKGIVIINGRKVVNK